jgi:hypothetical protein
MDFEHNKLFIFIGSLVITSKIVLLLNTIVLNAPSMEPLNDRVLMDSLILMSMFLEVISIHYSHILALEDIDWNLFYSMAFLLDLLFSLSFTGVDCKMSNSQVCAFKIFVWVTKLLSFSA